MTRRAVLVAAAAVALILAPSAAMAYSPSTAPSHAAVVVSRPMAEPIANGGVPFNVRATGARANEAVTLTITRRPASTANPRRQMTKNANASGVVEFAVAIAKDGTYSLVSTSASGSVLGRQSVTVVAHGTVIVAGEGASAAAGGTAAGQSGSGAGRAPEEAEGTTVASGRLSSTGFQGMGLAILGGVLVLAGSGLVLVAGFPRRRKPESPAGAGRRVRRDQTQAQAPA